MVLAAVLAATHPLPDAKACVSGGLEIRGSLIAESGDRVFLGEPTLDRPRRIVALPTAQVEELFIGPYAARARCNPPPAAIVAAGQAKKSTEFRETAHELLQQLDEASSLHTAAKPAVQLATAVRVIGNSTLIVAGAGDRADDSSNNALTEDVKRADAAGTRAAGSALFSRRRSIG